MRARGITFTIFGEEFDDAQEYLASLFSRTKANYLIA